MEFGAFVMQKRVKKKKSMWTLSFLFFGFIVWTNYISAFEMGQNLMEKSKENNNLPEEKEIYAKAAVLMDGKTKRILYNKNGSQPLPMASTTKIMTCIVALEEGKEDDETTISVNAASQPPVKLGLQKGEKIKIQDLLYSMMLESHNDSAVAIAEHIGGSVSNFTKIMNEKAKKIGCKDTFFLTPNGLDAKKGGKQHHTTAEDLAKILSYCLNDSKKSERFREITEQKNYQVKGKMCSNHNRLLDMIEGASSGKTGFTCEAGYCYTGSVMSNGRSFVVALLACGWPGNKGYKWEDCKKLFRYGMSLYTNVSLREILRKKEKENYFFNVEQGENQGKENKKICAKASLRAMSGEDEILLKKGEHVVIKKEMKKNVEAPVLRSTKVGEVSIYVEGKCYASMPIYSSKAIKRKNYQDVCYKIVEKILSFEIL